jgi:uncharacterized protein
VRRLAVSLLFVALATGACSTPPVIQPRRSVRLTSGSPGGGFQPLGDALAHEFRRAGFETSVTESDGSVSNVKSLLGGAADVGFAYADVAYLAHIGRLDGTSAGPRGLRALAVLELTPVHLLVRPGAGIASVESLRGRRVGVGRAGSGSALTARTVLRAFDLVDTATRSESLAYNDAAARLIDGSLDAMFVTGSVPLESVQPPIRAGAQLVPLVGPAIARLEREYPFFRPTIIPGGTYAGHPAAVVTIGVHNLLLVRSDLDESVAHDLTAALFDALPSLSGRQGFLRQMSVEQAPAAPVPLHDGAARFYRERELAR